VVQRLNRLERGLMGPRNHVLHVGAWRPGFPPREGALLKVILGHAQTCLRSIFLSLFVRGGGARAMQNLASSLL